MSEVFLSASILVGWIVVGVWVVHELELRLPRLWRKKPETESALDRFDRAVAPMREARIAELHRAHTTLQQENERLQAKLAAAVKFLISPSCTPLIYSEEFVRGYEQARANAREAMDKA